MISVQTRSHFQNIWRTKLINKFKDSTEAYKSLNSFILENGVKSTSRIGDCLVLKNVAFSIENPNEPVLEEENLRIKTDYANDFWDFMISGGTDAEEVFKAYPSVSKFIRKPKSKELPDNFNTFYGPRIVSQLPAVIKELKTNPDTRRAVILILDKDDSVLLDKDESLEYPCTTSITFNIEDGKLHSHVHMRSQNTAVVFQLDLLLQLRLLKHLAKILSLEVGTLNFSMVNAHIFERDFDYIKSVI